MQELHAVTTFYNPGRFRSKRVNYQRFRERLEAQRVPLLTVECTFDGTFELSDDCFRVGGGDVLWQKERLLNLAFAALPVGCNKVAWLDCDILFERDDWAEETSALLDEVGLVQPFAEVTKLPPLATEPDERADFVPGFAAVLGRAGPEARSPIFDLHGHTGYAWAARRDLLFRCGLYDACVAGGADHVMAHAAAGATYIDCSCVRRLLGENTPLLKHFRAWARTFAEEVDGSIGCGRGRIAHLWHGEHHNRRYIERQDKLAKLAFDPERDLEASADGPWRWSPARPELAHWAVEYFRARDEDGTAQ